MTNLEVTARETNKAALLDAAERLLVDVGHAGITTRRLAEEAGVNHGLVHYYFGSMENVLARALERFTGRMIERQRAMYADPTVPFIEKWRQAMRYLVEDGPYQKVWYELQSLAWNRPEFAGPVAEARAAWYAVLTEAFDQQRRELEIDVPTPVLVSLVATFNEGLIFERLSGHTAGHDALIAWIDGWLERQR
jgi:AcrR family transcriptional regulator